MILVMQETLDHYPERGIIGEGAGIQLFPAGECLGIAEGIETALPAWKRFDVRVGGRNRVVHATHYGPQVDCLRR